MCFEQLSYTGTDVALFSVYWGHISVGLPCTHKQATVFEY